MYTHPWLGGAVCLLLVACDVFDASLEKRLQNVDADAALTGDAQSATGVFKLSNGCSSDMPLVLGSAVPMTIPVEGLSSNIREGGECAVTREALAGADGFFSIAANAGERWHFHLDAAPGQNLAVFASPTCDLRECAAAADVCGTEESEHFTFVPETTGSYVIVVDGIDPNAKAPLTLLAVNPTCGDGKKEHSEVCDDRNVTGGDGCDGFCRVELSNADADEIEPNDDSYGANVLMPQAIGTQARIHGKIGGACQPDYYLLQVSEPRRFELNVLDGTGAACSGAPALELSLLGADRAGLRETVLLKRVEAAAGECPLLGEQPLAPGTYFLRLKQLSKANQFDYQLVWSLDAPS